MTDRRSVVLEVRCEYISTNMTIYVSYFAFIFLNKYKVLVLYIPKGNRESDDGTELVLS